MLLMPLAELELLTLSSLMLVMALLMISRPEASVEMVNWLTRFCVLDVVTVPPLKLREIAVFVSS